MVFVGAGTVHDAKEFIVNGFGDGTHGAIADEDAVDRAEVG